MPSYNERLLSFICLLAFVVVLMIADNNRTLRSSQAEVRSWLKTTSSDQTRELASMDGMPPMYTFWEPIGEMKAGQDAMLALWKDEWGKAGFDARIINLEDAKRHPDFEEMKNIVEELFPDDLHNRYCFYRYLAMAASEGGWMSDYDTLPTNFPVEEVIQLPNEGKFTSFEAHVPSLISATAGEWTRVARLMIDAIPRTRERYLVSDMYTLLVLREEQEDQTINYNIDFKEPWRNVKAKVQYKSARVINCRDMKIGRAIHFSPLALKRVIDNFFPLESEWPLSHSKRATAEKFFMDKWREQCGGPSIMEVY